MEYLDRADPVLGHPQFDRWIRKIPQSLTLAREACIVTHVYMYGAGAFLSKNRPPSVSRLMQSAV